jgi:hypothetical protein
MQFVQVYEALYQEVGPNNQLAIRGQDTKFGIAVRNACGIGFSQNSSVSATLPTPAPANAADCVVPLYQRQIAIWKGLLSGDALQEAERPISEQVALQKQLRTLGYLPAQAVMDAVFGRGTRSAITQWQIKAGLPPDGLLGDNDARLLLSENNASSPPTNIHP